MICIDDPLLPGLRDLAADRLSAITGASKVELLRLRYRRGSRAILHLASVPEAAAEPLQGAIWFYPGDKAKRLAKRNADAVFDPVTQALYEPFPQDHRMPEIRRFLDGYVAEAPPLIGDRPRGTPDLVRYRPGLSCTFRCHRADGKTVYVKLMRDESAARIATANALLADALEGTRLRIARSRATCPDLNAIAYDAVQGESLETLLANATPSEARRRMADAVAALRALWSARVTPPRLCDARALVQSGESACHFIREMIPQLSSDAERVMSRLRSYPPRLPLRPIHADMKLEHVFFTDGSVTLIDTESVSLGPPDYDLAQLFGRLHMAALSGMLSGGIVEAAGGVLLKGCGRHLAWCLGIVALRLAKFHAQRPGPHAATEAAAILARLGQTS